MNNRSIPNIRSFPIIQILFFRKNNYRYTDYTERRLFYRIFRFLPIIQILFSGIITIGLRIGLRIGLGIGLRKGQRIGLRIGLRIGSG